MKSYKTYHFGPKKKAQIVKPATELLVEMLIESAGGVSKACEALGLNRSTLNRWRQGSTPSEENVRAALAYLGLPASWISSVYTKK